ncbi:MAG TPA: ATP-grasp domain-containing protein [Thermodesulfobacteriota bacterium]|nr:ATP-grasp domain-containing protein [Thermodesulfobacteriota bacterium]
MKARVLVTDGHFRKTLAVVRSLGRKGVHVTVGERTFLNTSFFSKYCAKRLIYPSPRQTPGRFVEFFLKEIEKNHYDCLFPMEEETLLLLVRHHSDISRHAYLLSPDAKKIEFTRDKGNLMQFAETHGIPTPRTFRIAPEPSKVQSARAEFDKVEDPSAFAGRVDLAPVIEEIPIPAVIKPRISSGSLGIVYVKRRKDLLPSYRRVHEQFPFPIIQEWIPDGGGIYGLSALFDETSNVKAAFVHKKLRMFPVQGGPSTLGEGVDHPQIMELGLSLLQSLNWVGVGMAEFKVDPRDGIPKLMEVNPRFWGSLQLAIVSGVDFPYLMLRMARREKFEPVVRYTVGKRFRWLLLGDVFHFVKNPDRFHLHPSFFHFFDPQTCYDVFSKDDPLPFLGSAATLLTFLYDREMKRFLER